MTNLCKQGIREEFNLHTQLQGPQGCVSSVYSSNVAKHVKILQALRDTYPEIKSEIKTSAIGTKPNESTFSLVRGEQLTPDAFEFGRIYPKLVRETVLQSSVDPEFLYVTRQHKPKHYEQDSIILMYHLFPGFPKQHPCQLLIYSF